MGRVALRAVWVRGGVQDVSNSSLPDVACEVAWEAGATRCLIVSMTCVNRSALRCDTTMTTANLLARALAGFQALGRGPCPHHKSVVCEKCAPEDGKRVGR